MTGPCGLQWKGYCATRSSHLPWVEKIIPWPSYQEKADIFGDRLQVTFNCHENVIEPRHRTFVTELFITLVKLTSYRPISFLPILGKILEKLLLRRVYPIIHDSTSSLITSLTLGHFFQPFSGVIVLQTQSLLILNGSSIVRLSFSMWSKPLIEFGMPAYFWSSKPPFISLITLS